MLVCDKALTERADQPGDAPSRCEQNGLHLAAEGDLDTLYRLESAGLLRLARRINGAEDAHDVVQDVFARLAQLGAQFWRVERPRSYLQRMTVNILRENARRSNRRSESLGAMLDAGTGIGDPIRQLESRDMLNRLEAAIQALKPRTREIFMAHRLEGLSYAEIAERTGLSVKGVEKQMSKAIARIDRLMERA